MLMLLILQKHDLVIFNVVNQPMVTISASLFALGTAPKRSLSLELLHLPDLLRVSLKALDIIKVVIDVVLMPSSE